MPRIAVALGVVALIAFSIGFNTTRYTVVWDMVGGLPQSPQSGEPSEPASAAQPAGAAPPGAFGPSRFGRQAVPLALPAARQESPDHAESTVDIRRLPPADQVAPAANRTPSLSPMAPPPVYPSTGA